MSEWSIPYCGVQHYGSCGANAFWATVQDYGSFATALVWTPGCRFSPMETNHRSPAEARTYAEDRLYTLTNGRMGMRHQPEEQQHACR
jgi:hypothetical protein